VQKLRELVELRTPENFPDPGYTGIVARRYSGAQPLSTEDHGAQFEHPEDLGIPSQTLGSIEHREALQ
jgi:hypothetical protein